MWRRLAALLFGLALIGCATQNLSYQDIQEREKLIEKEKEFFSGATLVALDQWRVQIEYHSPDGRAYLWYPGNVAVNQGQWDVRARKDSWDLMLCWRYMTSTNTKPFGTRGDGATCKAIGLTKRNSWYEGDPYNLQSGRIPFVIPRGTTTHDPSLGPNTQGPDQLNLVIARTGINPANLRQRR